MNHAQRQQAENKKITVLDHVNNYFYMHKDEHIRASDLKEVMINLGSPIKSAVQQICLLVKRGDAICVIAGGGHRQSVYMATEKIQYITESVRKRVYQKKQDIKIEHETPEGVLMLQNIFIPNSAALISMSIGLNHGI